MEEKLRNLELLEVVTMEMVVALAGTVVVAPAVGMMAF